MTAAADAPDQPAAGAAAGALRGVDRGLFQVVALLWTYALYDLLRVGVTGSTAAATAHAHRVAAVEHFLGLGAERWLQQAAMRLPWLVGACNAYYAMGHLIVPPVVLLILYRRAPARYRHWRNVFVVLLGLALITFWLYPLAPPRLMPGPGQVVDTSRAYFSFNQTPLGALGARAGTAAPALGGGGTNPFAAMPSLHVAWALWTALALWPVVRRRWTKLLLALYPLAMVLVVLVTGNHWLIDALAGAVVTALAVALVTVGSRRTRRLTGSTGAESPAGHRPEPAPADGLGPFGFSVPAGPLLR